MQFVLFGNSLLQWGIAMGIAAGAAIILILLRRNLHRLFSHRGEEEQRRSVLVVAKLLERTHPLFLILVGLFLGSQALELEPAVRATFTRVFIVALFLQGALWGHGLVEYARDVYIGRLTDKRDISTVSVMALIGKIIVWVVAALLVLDYLEIPITSLVAGLGIGGLAVALAVQNILGDLFASFSIILDKPFAVGDFIVVDDKSGTVENVGLKTTRVRSLTGEQLVFSNHDLLNSRIHNYRLMEERRVDFTFGVRYDTPYEKLIRIPEMVQAIIEGIEAARFDRTHFKEYGDFALIFEVVYYVRSQDYLLYMDTQQAINLELCRRFREEDIHFAYPTQTIYVQDGTA